MRVTIPDDLADAYAAYAEKQGVTLDDLVTKQLERFRRLEPGHKAIVIQADVLTSAESWLGATPLRHGEDLVERLSKHGQITFASYNLGLSHQQKLELQHRATRQGRPVSALVEDIWRDLQANFFWNSGGGEAKAPVAKAG